MEVSTMGLSYQKEEQLREQPIIKSTMRKSRDGKLFIHKTTFTQIKPVQYVEAVLQNKQEAELFEDEDEE